MLLKRNQLDDRNSENTKQFNIQLFRTMSKVKATTTSVKLTVDSLVEWRRWPLFAQPGCNAELALVQHLFAVKSVFIVGKRAKTFLFSTKLYTFIYRPLQQLKKKKKHLCCREEPDWWDLLVPVLQCDVENKRGTQTDCIKKKKKRRSENDRTLNKSH